MRERIKVKIKERIKNIKEKIKVILCKDVKKNVRERIMVINKGGARHDSLGWCRRGGNS